MHCQFVKGKQCIIAWHVDNLKVSLVCPNVVTKIINWLKKTYECLFDNGTGKMKVCCEKYMNTSV